MTVMKDVILIGGANGAGKTTAAGWLLPRTLGIREFVNGDEIAKGLSPFNPEGSVIAAARLMLTRVRSLIRAGESFAFETTCAGRGHAQLLKSCRSAGYRITVIFLWLPTVAMAQARVAQRVREGGHNVPAPIVARRFAAGLRNLRRLYLPLADVALIYDNASVGGVLVAERSAGGEFIVHDAAKWRMIEEATA